MIKKTFVADEIGDQEGGGAIAKKTKEGLPQILLKLATANGYNHANNIRGPNGAFIPDTDVLRLAVYACTSERYLKGKKEFAMLLSQVGVDSGSVANETIRRRMIQPLSRQPSVEEVNDQSIPGPHTATTASAAFPPPPPLTYHGPVPRRIRRIAAPRPAPDPDPLDQPLPEPVANVSTKRTRDDDNIIEKRFAANGYRTFDDE